MNNDNRPKPLPEHIAHQAGYIEDSRGKFYLLGALALITAIAVAVILGTRPASNSAFSAPIRQH